MATPLRNPDFSGNEIAYTTDCLRRGWVSRGSYYERLEKALSDHFGRRAYFTSSGTGALWCSLKAAGIGEGDEVIVPALTFGSTLTAVLSAGATPVIVDVSDDWTISEDGVKEAASERSAAVIPVDIYGIAPPDLSWMGMTVIRDACEARLDRDRSDYRCHSFYGNKHLTCGEGGLVVTDDADVAKWRDGGFDATYNHSVPGLNWRASDIQAAVLLAQFERYGAIMEGQQSCIDKYRSRLEGRGDWLFCVETESPYLLAAGLAEDGIDTRLMFRPLDAQRVFKQYAPKPCDNAARIAATHLCLPTGGHVDVDAVCARVEFHERKIRHGDYDARGTADCDQLVA